MRTLQSAKLTHVMVYDMQVVSWGWANCGRELSAHNLIHQPERAETQDKSTF
jgi:hypothetical protein